MAKREFVFLIINLLRFPTITRRKYLLFLTLFFGVLFGKAQKVIIEQVPGFNGDLIRTFIAEEKSKYFLINIYYRKAQIIEINSDFQENKIYHFDKNLEESFRFQGFDDYFVFGTRKGHDEIQLFYSTNNYYGLTRKVQFVLFDLKDQSVEFGEIKIPKELSTKFLILGAGSGKKDFNLFCLGKDLNFYHFTIDIENKVSLSFSNQLSEVKALRFCCPQNSKNLISGPTVFSNSSSLIRESKSWMVHEDSLSIYFSGGKKQAPYFIIYNNKSKKIKELLIEPKNFDPFTTVGGYFLPEKQRIYFGSANSQSLYFYSSNLSGTDFQDILLEKENNFWNYINPIKTNYSRVGFQKLPMWYFSNHEKQIISSDKFLKELEQRMPLFYMELFDNKTIISFGQLTYMFPYFQENFEHKGVVANFAFEEELSSIGPAPEKWEKEVLERFPMEILNNNQLIHFLEIQGGFIMVYMDSYNQLQIQKVLY
jgi:hypothetical protein